MSVISRLKRTDDEPHDRLTRLCEELSDRLPEGVKALILLDEDDRGGMVAHGYEDDAEIGAAFARHRRAFLLSAEERLRGE